MNEDYIVHSKPSNNQYDEKFPNWNFWTFSLDPWGRTFKNWFENIVKAMGKIQDNEAQWEVFTEQIKQYWYTVNEGYINDWWRAKYTKFEVHYRLTK